MKPRLEHWRCERCRERGSVKAGGSASTFLLRVFAQHFERSPDCELAPNPVPIAVKHDGHAWVLRKPEAPADA